MKKILLVLFTVFSFFNSDAQNLINGGFEEGPGSGWTVYSPNGAGLIGTASFFYSTSIEPAVNPRSGQYMGRIGGFGYAVNSLSQNVTLPATQKVYLHVHYQDRASTTSECSGLWVGARVQVIVAGQALTDVYLCYSNQMNDWTHVYYDLSAAAGMNVNITFKAEAANSVWSYLYLDDISITSSITEVEDNISVPERFKLFQNYPNPFNPVTHINFYIPFESKVKLEIFNSIGELIETPINKTVSSGYHTTLFDAARCTNGVYFYRLTSIAASGKRDAQTKKMTILK